MLLGVIICNFKPDSSTFGPWQRPKTGFYQPKSSCISKFNKLKYFKKSWIYRPRQKILFIFLQQKNKSSQKYRPSGPKKHLNLPLEIGARPLFHILLLLRYLGPKALDYTLNAGQRGLYLPSKQGPKALVYPMKIGPQGLFTRHIKLAFPGQSPMKIGP